MLTCDPTGVHQTVSSTAVFDEFIDLCIANLFYSGVGLILGYLATFFLIDRWGRKPIQLMGFIVLTILFVIMGTLPLISLYLRAYADSIW